MDFDIDQRDRYGRTALMWAAEMNHKETVETLIDLGSDRKLVEPTGGRYENKLHAGNKMLYVIHNDFER